MTRMLMALTEHDKTTNDLKEMFINTYETYIGRIGEEETDQKVLAENLKELNKIKENTNDGNREN